MFPEPGERTCVTVPFQLEDWLRGVEGEGKNRLVTAATDNKALWVFVIRGHDCHTEHKVVVTAHAVTLRVTQGISGRTNFIVKLINRFISQLFINRNFIQETALTQSILRLHVLFSWWDCVQHKCNVQ